MTQTDNLGN